jgi:hypothetical protein
MLPSLFILAASVAAVNAQGALPAPSSTVVAAAGSLPLGAPCANSVQCAGGAQCFASNFMQITSCGKYNAACNNDSQCATNLCINGLCNGILASSLWLQPMPTQSSSTGVSTSIVMATSSTSALAAPSATIVAAAGSLPLGAECATSQQCAFGAECYASNFMLIKQCGKFNAACTSDSQCATNTCVNRLCSGYLDPSAYLANNTVALGAPCNRTSVCVNGAECAVSAAWQEAQYPVCGAFNSTCTNSNQCAQNSCFKNRCAGVIGYETSIVSGKPTWVAVNSTAVVTAPRTATSHPATYTGAATKFGAEAGVAAVLGAVAFML